MGIETAALAAYAAAGATALTAAGMVMQGQQQKKMADYNADVAQEEANQQKASALIQAEKVRKAMRAQQGEARSAMAASGVDVGVGTAEQIQTDIGTAGEEDALSLILSGRRKANTLEGEAGLSRYGGRAAANAATVSALGQIASSAATYGRWKAGVGSGTGGGQYNYNNDESGARFSASGADVRARR